MDSRSRRSGASDARRAGGIHAECLPLYRPCGRPSSGDAAPHAPRRPSGPFHGRGHAKRAASGGEREKIRQEKERGKL
jgi:hypothetical protein